MRAALVGPLVPLDAHPREVAQDGLLRLPGRARGVGVLDAEDKLASDVFGKEVVEERGAGSPDVEVARRGGGEADARLLLFVGRERREGERERGRG